MISIKRFTSKSNFQLCAFHVRYITEKKKQQCDMIGPADPVSNLHPIKYSIPDDPTPLAKELHQKRTELQEWNEIFWTKHNLNFIQKKKDFEKKKLAMKGCDEQFLTADEVSVFYKKFLDENWKSHLKYLQEWYTKTVYVTYLQLRLKVEKLYRKS